MSSTITWLLSIPKEIDSNGCWISKYAIRSDGYVRVRRGKTLYLLHRLAMCSFKNLNYYDQSMESRHSDLCNKACFNPDHLIPGSHMDNIRDAVKLGKFKKEQTPNCPRCGNPYATVMNKAGYAKGKSQRYCRHCSKMRRRKSKVDSI